VDFVDVGDPGEGALPRIAGNLGGRQRAHKGGVVGHDALLSKDVEQQWK
jgi:hypothetical protein